jgi:hypothetical protein
MSKITYLFGAGASANVLPVVNNIHSRILELCKFLNIYHNEQNLNFKALIKDLHWLEKIADPKENTTIDTYAKLLYLQSKNQEKNDEYIKLRCVLSYYFILEQLKPQNIDKRYIDFWVSLLNPDYRTVYDVNLKDTIPNNITLLSWNYDNQIELSFKEVTGGKFSKSLTKRFDDPDTFKPTQADDQKIHFQLNGHAGFDTKHSYDLDFYSKQKLEDNLSKVVDHHSKMPAANLADNNNYNQYCMLSFAWFNFKNLAFNLAQQKTKDTEVLVIIGYSFPYFNRQIDRLLMGAENMPNLRKIYIQCKDDNKIIADRLQSIRDTKNIEVIPISDANQFFIPPEL